MRGRARRPQRTLPRSHQPTRRSNPSALLQDGLALLPRPEPREPSRAATPASPSGAPASRSLNVIAAAVSGHGDQRYGDRDFHDSRSELGNNSATAADVVATATQADLIITNTAVPTSVAAGSNVAYTQTVTNNGPVAATDRDLYSSHSAQHKLSSDHGHRLVGLADQAGGRGNGHDHLHGCSASP